MINNMDKLEKIKIPINKEKVLLFIIGILLIILIISFSYIKVQKSFDWEKPVPEQIIETGIPATASSSVMERQDFKEAFAGASFIAADNKVLDNNSRPADNSAIPHSPQAPKSIVVNKEKLPQEVLNLKIKDVSISPSSFTVKSGDLISLAVSSDDGKVHGFAFYNAALSAISMGIDSNQTKAINFNAPVPGEYEFGCGIPQHVANGEKGIMIVK